MIVCWWVLSTLVYRLLHRKVENPDWWETYWWVVLLACGIIIVVAAALVVFS